MPFEHTVRQGDCVNSIAFEHGFLPATIWNHPANAALKEKRKDPNVLMPGDVVVIPDKREKQFAAATGVTHRYRRKGVPKVLRIQVKRLDEPLPREPFTLDVDGRIFTGTTDGEGWVVQGIPPNARRARLSVDDHDYDITLGHLDPIDTIAGVQARLRILGYYDGPIDDTLSPATKSAVRKLQMMENLDPTGEIDDDTRALLVHESGA